MRLNGEFIRPAGAAPVAATWEPRTPPRVGFWHLLPGATARAEHGSSAPVVQTLDPLCDFEGIVDLDAKIANGTFDAGWPSKSCTARKFPVRR